MAGRLDLLEFVLATLSEVTARASRSKRARRSWRLAIVFRQDLDGDSGGREQRCRPFGLLRIKPAQCDT